ncbi:helix-turn-helix transcriptional regulator [bacterium]|nr:helix-turn-helix transcriptional regulator [bacterium]
MIRFRLQELIADKGFKEDRVVTLAEVARDSGIHRATLSKIAHERGYSTGTDIIERLCIYFDCEIADVMQLVREDQD